MGDVYPFIVNPAKAGVSPSISDARLISRPSPG
jgi:hypothetical protein